MAKLYEINEYIQQLEFELEQIDDGAEQAERIRELLDQAEDAREDKLLNVARWRKQLQTENKEVIGGEISRLQARKKAQERKVDGLAQYLEYGLKQVEGQRVKSAIGSLWIQRNSKPTVMIAFPDLVSDEFWVPAVSVVDKKTTELPAGQYKFKISDSTITLYTIDKNLISDHYKETGEIPKGTEIRWGSSVRFR